MQRALALARRSLGAVSPNPAVGAVVVRGGSVVGEGRTRPPGGDHAEVGALREAGDLARGADMLVTLEPCSRHGRTPPCTDAIVAAGIGRVTVGCVDPHPDQRGAGLEALRSAGIEASLAPPGPESAAASRLIQGYGKHLATGRPFITAKFAISLDGKIATRTGSSAWITGGPARARAHALRAESDAIVVGIGTVLADDPRLTVRGGQGEPVEQQPLRVIVDSDGRTPLDATVASDGGRTLVACLRMEPAARASLERLGVEVAELPEGAGGVDLAALMDLLGGLGVTSALAEGGGRLAGSLFEDGLVDRVAAFIAPMIIGGVEAPGPVGGRGVADIADALRLRDCTWEGVGEDILVIGYPA